MYLYLLISYIKLNNIFYFILHFLIAETFFKLNIIIRILKKVMHFVFIKLFIYFNTLIIGDGDTAVSDSYGIQMGTVNIKYSD